MEYQHGGDIYGKSRIRLDFSVNTSPFGMPESVRAAVAGSAESWERYPDCFCRSLRQKLADYFNEELSEKGTQNAGNALSAEDFLCGGGASDLLYSLAFALKPKKALLLAPCFSEYEKALTAAGCSVSCFLLDREKDFSPEADEKALYEFIEREEDADLLILGNPNNPTGMAVSAKWLARLAVFCREKGILLVVDECFNWFLENRSSFSILPIMAAEPKQYDHVILLNAFTKIFAMAGLRFGFAVLRDREIRETIEACRQPWSVSGPAQAGGEAALSERELIEKTVKAVAEEREFLSDGLEKLGFRVYPSKVNYLLFESDTAFNYEDYCREKGILIRSCRNFSGLNNRFYRIAVKRREENEELLRCLGREG